MGSGRTEKMNDHQLASKIKEICKERGITIHPAESGKNRANREQKAIWINEISDSGDFAAALHEIGHVMCDPARPPRNPRETLDAETNAWQWALDYNGDDFDRRGWRRLHDSLHQYYVALMDTSLPAYALLVRAEEKDPGIRSRVSEFGAPSLGSLAKKTTKPKP